MRAWTRSPTSIHEKISEILRSSVRAGRLAAKAQLHCAVSGRRYVKVRSIEVEDRFGVTEFEVHSPVPHFDRGNCPALFGVVQQQLKVPRPGIWLHQID